MDNLSLPVFEETGVATDTFLKTGALTDKLKDDFRKYGRIIVAYDYDYTVYSDDLDKTSQVRELLREISKYPDDFYMIVFTARHPEDYVEVEQFLDGQEIRHDAINKEAPDVGLNKGQKILYNIFLDDRAGLRTAYEELANFFYWFIHDYKGVS